MNSRSQKRGLRGALICLCALSLFGARAADNNSLDAALARIDKAAAGFKGLTANMRRVHHTEVLGKDEVDEGTIVVKKYKPGDIRVRIDLTTPDPKIVVIGGGKAQSFAPKTN